MKDLILQGRGLWFISAVALFGFALVSPDAREPEMKADELVARHLASIGTPEAIAAVRNRTISGAAQAVFRLPKSAFFVGSGAVVSEGRRMGIRMTFPSVEYPWEEFAYDGRKVTANQVRPGERSALSDFVYQWDFLLKEGLISVL
jgi:hypothetical protein